MSAPTQSPAEAPTPGREPTRPRRTVALIAVVVGVVLALFVVLLATSPDDPDRAVASPVVGGQAPAIDATDTRGRSVQVSDYRGRWLLVNFFATWCVPCRDEHPELVEFAASRSADGSAAVISIAYDDEPAAVDQFFRTNGGDWPVIAQGNAALALEYGVIRLPESYLVDPDGVVAAKLVGGITAAELDQTITELEAKR